MGGRNRKRSILMVGQTPPPLHGQAIVTQQLFDAEWPGFDVECLSMAYSRHAEEIGKFRIGKVAHLLGLTVKTIGFLIRNRGSILYYPPAGPNTVPILRDIIYLILSRPFAKGVVFHYHGGGLAEFLETRPLLRMFANLAYRKALISIEISRRGVSPGEYFKTKERKVVPNGLIVPKSIGRAPLEGRVPRILFVGGLSEGKGIFDLLETARILRDRKRSVKFLIVGEWWDEKDRVLFEKKLSAYDLTEEWIEMCGSVSGEIKWEVFGRADVMFFPSHYEAENFPLALIEAMGTGLPVVASKWRGIPEIVSDGETGILCPINDPTAYANAITELLDDTEQAREMGEKGRARYEMHFTDEVFRRNMSEVFLAAFDQFDDP